MTTQTGSVTAVQAAFWQLAENFLDVPGVEEGTLMGNRCLRVHGDFLATVHRRSGHLVVKLGGQRTQELIDAGTGVPFAPAGRVFREWVAIPDLNATLWRQLIAEGIQRHGCVTSEN